MYTLTFKGFAKIYAFRLLDSKFLFLIFLILLKIQLGKVIKSVGVARVYFSSHKPT